MNEVDDAIARYRAELTQEAALAERDLAELEDHFRSLVDELRATQPLAAAIAAARQRLGDPRAVAREHARVRTSFGARLSRARAWSAVALLAPMAAYGSYLQLTFGGVSLLSVFHAAFSLGVLVALAARATWARAYVLGGLPLSILTLATLLADGPSAGSPVLFAYLAADAAALAFLAPWRRGELGPAGAGLALLPAIYLGAVTLLGLVDIRYAPMTPAAALGVPALAGLLLGSVGAVLRARWAAVATATAAVALATATVLALAGDDGFAGPPYVYRLQLAGVILGALGAAVAAAIQWRTARTAPGTVRALR